jgi:hypothetical protein
MEFSTYKQVPKNLAEELMKKAADAKKKVA